jgi:ribonuclease HI
MNKVQIYTDGGCRGNPGIGGWGALLEYGEKQKTLKGNAKLTTNNQMELTAIIEALKSLKSDKVAIDLYTDSKYALDGINSWIKGWKKNNWKTATKKPVKNQELWQELDALNQKYDISWHWVKGHSGNRGNDIVDELANIAMDGLL